MIRQKEKYIGKSTVREIERISVVKRQSTLFCLWFKFKLTAKGEMMQEVMWAVFKAPMGKNLFSMK